MQELIANPGIPLNYKKMCSEVEQSLSKFEAYLDAKKSVVRTFDIDAPTSSTYSREQQQQQQGSGNGGKGAAAGLALSTKKML